MNDNIHDVISKYSDNNPERNEEALANLKKANLESELLALQVLEKAQYLDLRKEWSFHIKIAFWIILAAGITFTTLLGLGIFDYFFYPIFPHIVLSTFVIEVIGLAFIVAKFLFPKYTQVNRS